MNESPMKNYVVDADDPGKDNRKVLPGDSSEFHMTPSQRMGRSRRDSVAIAKEKYHSWAAKEKSVKSRIFHPNTSTFLPKWDGIVGVALLFTATVTPFEVSFLSSSINFLFFVNRMFDCVFVFDIWVNSRLAYFEPQERKWVVSKPEIRRHYAHGWLPLDVVSTIPYDLVDFVMPSGSGSNTDQLKILRVLKVLKLVKLLRIIKGARVFARVQQSLDISHANAALIQYAVGMILLVHWIACLWGLGPAFSNHSWAHARGPTDETRFIDLPPWEMYVLCVYYAVQSIVMGESEDHIPVTPQDRLLAVFCMITGGTVYAYVIGSICSILAMRDPATREFKESCDLVSKFSIENDLPKDLETNLKEYFLNSEPLFRNRMYGKVYDDMTPSLQRKIANSMHGAWLKDIPFFTAEDREEREGFVAALSTLLEPCTFPPHEEIYVIGHKAHFMMIITRGMATSAGNRGTIILKAPMHFGEQMILRHSRRSTTVRAITYLNCNKLDRDKLEGFLDEHEQSFPQTARLVRKARVRMALRRCLNKINSMFSLVLGKRSWTKEEMDAYRQKLRAQAELSRERAAEKARVREQKMQQEREQQRMIAGQSSSGAAAAKGGGFSLITGGSNKNEPQTIEQYRQEFAKLTTPEFAQKVSANIEVIASEYSGTKPSIAASDLGVSSRSSMGADVSPTQSSSILLAPVLDRSSASEAASERRVTGVTGVTEDSPFLQQMMLSLNEQLKQQEIAMAQQQKLITQQTALLESFRKDKEDNQPRRLSAEAMTPER